MDSPLTETTEPGGNKGSIGALTSIAGAIDCGDQQTGTSTIVVSGTTAEGPLDGMLSPVRVQCTLTAQGTYVSVTGLTQTGTTPIEVIVNATTDSFTVAASSKAGSSGYYTGKGAGFATLVPGGVHVSGDVMQAESAGGASHTLHVDGDATCGSTVGP